MKKPGLLRDLAVHLDAGRLLSDNPWLTRRALCLILEEAAASMEAAGQPRADTTPAAAPAQPAEAPAPAGDLFGMHIGSHTRLRMYTDGASRGNPGEAGIGVLIEDESGRPVKRLARYLGKATNNIAEYTALIDGLKAAAALGAEDVSVMADSELMVKQMNGLYQVKNPELKEKHTEARRLVKNFSRFTIKYIPREQNRAADALANEAIDKRSV